MNKEDTKQRYEQERRIAQNQNHRMVVFRRNQSYKAIKDVLLPLGLMKYSKDTGGYDRFMKALAAGKYRLELVKEGDNE